MNLFQKYKLLTEATKTNFQKWFGKSVLHTDGVPHTFYHGTSSDFDSFKSGTGNQWGSGHYFTRSPLLASQYATGDTEGAHARIAPDGNASPNVIPVHLKMEHPFVMDDELKRSTITKIERHIGEKLTDQLWGGMKNRDLHQILHLNYTNNIDGANHVLKSIGYDGIREKSDNSTHMVFHPNQIKSAIGNSGAYSKKSDSITESSDEISAFRDKLMIEHPELKSLHLYDHGSDLRLDMIQVDKDHRNQGVGSKVIQKIKDYADEHKQRVTLTAGVRDPHMGTTSQSRLDKFYKGHGFVANKGRNKDFSITATHYYTPK